MSKLKTPREKKLASLAYHSRNVYGENDKASRKSIPKGKRRGHKVIRRAAQEVLHAVSSAMQEDEIVASGALARTKETLGKRSAFRKRSDAPLGNLLKYKTTGDWKLLWRKLSC